MSWELPTWNESLVLVGALARLGARQNPLIPIYRGREVGFITAQSEAALLVVPTVYRGFDFEAMAREIAADRPGLAVLVVDRDLPDGDPAGLPQVEPPPATRGRGPHPVALLHLGHHRRPQGRPAHRPDGDGRRRWPWPSASTSGPDDVSALVFPFTHIGGIGWLIAALLHRVHPAHHRGVRPGGHPGLPGRQPGDPGRLGHRRSTWPTWPPSGRPGRARSSRRSGPTRAAGRPSRPSSTTTCKREIGGVGIVSGYGLTEAPIVVMATTERPRREAGRHRGAAHARGRAHRGRRSTAGGPARARRARSG